jgi:hypothetical protein
MDLLSFLPLPNEIIHHIISFGYCHPIIDKIKEKYNTKIITDISLKNQNIQNLQYFINIVIRNQIDDIAYNKYIKKNKKAYKRITDLFYKQLDLHDKDYYKFANKFMHNSFPLLDNPNISTYIPSSLLYYKI